MGNLTEIEYLKSRWEASLDEQRSSAVLLDDLLNADDRLARSEGLYATALVAYNVSFATLNRAHGHVGGLPDPAAVDSRICRRPVAGGISAARRRPISGIDGRCSYGRKSALPATAIGSHHPLLRTAPLDPSCEV